MSVRHALLGLLARQPSHGYELHRAFGTLLADVDWDVKPAQVYTTLSRLEDGGFVQRAGVERDGGPQKRIYAITDAGRLELERWFSEGVTGEHAKDEFFVKLMSAVNGGLADPRRVIHTQRTTLYRDLHTITAHRNRLDPRRQLATMLLLDKAVMHLEADLRWIDMIEARLEDVKRQPVAEPPPKRRGRPPKRAVEEMSTNTSDDTGAGSPDGKERTWPS